MGKLFSYGDGALDHLLIDAHGIRNRYIVVSEVATICPVTTFISSHALREANAAEYLCRRWLIVNSSGKTLQWTILPNTSCTTKNPSKKFSPIKLSRILKFKRIDRLISVRIPVLVQINKRKKEKKKKRKTYREMYHIHN